VVSKTVVMPECTRDSLMVVPCISQSSSSPVAQVVAPSDARVVDPPTPAVLYAISEVVALLRFARHS
jgi:hypothetical protein